MSAHFHVCRAALLTWEAMEESYSPVAICNIPHKDSLSFLGDGGTESQLGDQAALTHYVCEGHSCRLPESRYNLDSPGAQVGAGLPALRVGVCVAGGWAPSTDAQAH